MNEQEAVEIIHAGLVGEESLPARLRRGDGLHRETFERVRAAARFLIERWSDRESVPKRLAAAFVDVQAAMEWGRDRYSEAEQDAIEDAAVELVGLAEELFEDPN